MLTSKITRLVGSKGSLVRSNAARSAGSAGGVAQAPSHAPTAAIAAHRAPRLLRTITRETRRNSTKRAKSPPSRPRVERSADGALVNGATIPHQRRAMPRVSVGLNARFAPIPRPAACCRKEEFPMRLTASQLEQYRRDGFLIFPDLFAADEVDILRREVARLARVETDAVVREGAARAPKSMFRMHETDGATASPAFRALTRTPRALAVAQQVLGDERLYLHHSKVNVKTAIEGSVWPWHQDYGSWMRDGIQTPDLATLMIAFDRAT